jgi:hypothetical protein
MQKLHKSPRIAGYLMAVCGIILIFVTVLNYLLGWKWGIPPGVLGIVFIAVGMSWVKKSREKGNADAAKDNFPINEK